MNNNLNSNKMWWTINSYKIYSLEDILLPERVNWWVVETVSGQSSERVNKVIRIVAGEQAFKCSFGWNEPKVRSEWIRLHIKQLYEHTFFHELFKYAINVSLKA